MTLGMHHLLSRRRTKTASLKTREKDWQNSAASLVVFDIPGLYLDSSFICPHVQKPQSNLEVMPLNAGSKLIDPTSLSWCKLDSDARGPLDWATVPCLWPRVQYVGNPGRPPCLFHRNSTASTPKPRPSRIPCFETVFFCCCFPLAQMYQNVLGKAERKDEHCRFL